MKAHQSSLTATLIAAATVMCADDPRSPPPPGASTWCARFLQQSRRGRWLLASIRWRLGCSWWRAVERQVLPGIVAHWMCRKRAIDRLAREAAAEGFTQLVVLGAGLDSLAFRMSEERVFSHVLSADHPATLSIVQSSSQSVSDPAVCEPTMPTPPLEFLAINLLSDDLNTVLSQASTFDSRRATLFVIEGVLMYLPEVAVARLLRSLAALPGERKRLIASWMRAEAGQPVGFHRQSGLVNGMLSRSNENMLWGTTPDALLSALREWGWNNPRIVDLSRHDSCDSFHSAGLPSEQLAIAETRS